MSLDLGFIQPDVFTTFNSVSPYFNIWITVFFLFTLIRLGLLIVSRGEQNIYNSMIGEAAGLPFILMHSVSFVKAIQIGDWFGAILFAWWGPGFLVTVVILALSRKGKINFNWKWYGKVTSITCKLNYLILVLVYASFGLYSVIFTFSIWIIHDQINLAWFCQNADRTRRTFEDYWFIRLLYLGGLFIPFIFPIPFGNYFRFLGSALFLLWIISIRQLVKQGVLLKRPDGKGKYLRDIIYLSINEKSKAG